MMDNYVYLDKEEIYDILCGCDIRTLYTKEDGSREMVEDNEVMEQFLPDLLYYINEKLVNNKLILE